METIALANVWGFADAVGNSLAHSEVGWVNRIPCARSVSENTLRTTRLQPPFSQYPMGLLVVITPVSPLCLLEFEALQPMASRLLLLVENQAAEEATPHELLVHVHSGEEKECKCQ